MGILARPAYGFLLVLFGLFSDGVRCAGDSLGAALFIHRSRSDGHPPEMEYSLDRTGAYKYTDVASLDVRGCRILCVGFFFSSGDDVCPFCRCFSMVRGCACIPGQGDMMGDVVLVALISFLTAIVVQVVGQWLSRRLTKAQAASSEGDAAAKLSSAAATQIQTFNDEIIVPLRERIDGLEKENQSLRLLLVEANTRYESMRKTSLEQMEGLQRQVRDLNRSLDTQREQITILIEQSEAKDRTIRQMQREIEQLQHENEMLRGEIEKLRHENNTLKTKPLGA